MKNLVLLLFVLVAIEVDAQHLKAIKIDNGNIRLKIPEAFLEMTPDDMILRYPSVRNPLAAYSSLDRVADISVKISASQWAPRDIEIASSFFKASLMELIDKVKMIDEGVKEVNGKKFIVFEFDSHLLAGQSGEPEKKYNYIMYNVGIERTLVFSFRCPDWQKDEYQEAAREIMASIKIKK